MLGSADERRATTGASLELKCRIESRTAFTAAFALSDHSETSSASRAGMDTQDDLEIKLTRHLPEISHTAQDPVYAPQQGIICWEIFDRNQSASTF